MLPIAFETFHKSVNNCFNIYENCESLTQLILELDD